MGAKHWFFGGIIGLVPIIYIFYLAYKFTFSVSVKPNERGFLDYYGNIEDVLSPGLNILPNPLYTIVAKKTGFDTDFLYNLTFKTYDNYYVRIPTIYIDNEIDCYDENMNATKEEILQEEKKCLKNLYKNYFIGDAKVRAKSDDEFVPEEGLIFKFMPKIMSEVGNNLTAYQTQTHQWTTVFPFVEQQLRKAVPKGQIIHAIRMDRPVIEDIEWITSIQGMFFNRIYRTCKWFYTG
jgi:hypothetical protein